ncbi:AAA-domain-containing protein [Hesseltinella vesiculosa]|uniref:AAA-domain-containing protein n=1 Tax=Hesseltinella vesiculosa TaxID=101127 RepID=A0A1X2GTI5_9FUNG|nr:AAA-domain-containing protein [Hesseltinella vesiculosa]
MEDTLAAARPSGLSAFASPAPNVQFCDIYGMDTVIRDIKASVITPFQRPEQYIALGITAPKGILLHGPPGTGKTMICCALAREAGVNYIFVESTQLRSKVVGESEKSIANLFSHARSNSPCILFIDQIDILVPKRGSRSTSENTGDRIVTGFLTATNRIEVIDEAVLRPGRFDEHIQIQLPDQHQRKAIIQGLTKKIPLEMSPEQLDEMVTQSRGWAGADLENILREAAMENLRQDRQATKCHTVSKAGIGAR